MSSLQLIIYGGHFRGQAAIDCQVEGAEISDMENRPDNFLGHIALGR